VRQRQVLGFGRHGAWFGHDQAKAIRADAGQARRRKAAVQTTGCEGDRRPHGSGPATAIGKWTAATSAAFL